MRNLAIIVISLVLSACVKPPEPTIAWHKMCFPVQFLTPASIHFAKQSDPNFDTDEDAPSVFYDAAYLENKLPNFQPSYTSKEYGELLNNMMVTILLRDKPSTEKPTGTDLTPFEQSKNLFKQIKDPYSWSLFDNSSGKLELWGRCSLFSPNNYDCMRRIYHNDMLLIYTVHMTNLALYKELDQFIIDDLTRWQCE